VSPPAWPHEWHGIESRSWEIERFLTSPDIYCPIGFVAGKQPAGTIFSHIEVLPRRELPRLQRTSEGLAATISGIIVYAKNPSNPQHQAYGMYALAETTWGYGYWAGRSLLPMIRPCF